VDAARTGTKILANPSKIQRPPAKPGEHTEDALRDWGLRQTLSSRRCANPARSAKRSARRATPFGVFQVRAVSSLQ